jgi:hypothetical protein
MIFIIKLNLICINKQYTHCFIMESMQPSATSKMKTKISQFFGRAFKACKYVTLLIISNTLLHIVAYFIMCNISHHCASKLYSYFCTVDHLTSLTALTMSPFTLLSPHCMAIRWVMMESVNMVYFQLLMLGSWVVSKIP